MKSAEEIRARINELKEMEADVEIRRAWASRGSYVEGMYDEMRVLLSKEISTLKWVLGDEET